MAATLTLAAAAPAQETKPPSGADVTVVIGELQNAKGQLLASAFTSDKGFPSDYRYAVQRHIATITNTFVCIVFTNMSPGPCAIGICHDENANGKIDTRLFGRPTEGYGLSENPGMRLGRPRFKDSTFVVTTNDIKRTITLVYPERQYQP